MVRRPKSIAAFVPPTSERAVPSPSQSATRLTSKVSGSKRVPAAVFAKIDARPPTSNEPLSTTSPSTPAPTPSTTGPSTLAPTTSTTGPSTLAPTTSTTGPATTAPSTLAPATSTTGPSTTGPSTLAPATSTGPATTGPSTLAPATSTTGPSTLAPAKSTTGPATTGPSTLAPATSTTGPSTTGPSTLAPATSTTGPSTLAPTTSKTTPANASTSPANASRPANASTAPADASASSAPADPLDSEAARVLRPVVERSASKFGIDRFLRHILTVAPSDWSIQHATGLALLRRFHSAASQAVFKRPRRAFGTYVVGRKPRNPNRTYQVRVDSIDPPVARCACPDYAKSSLGLCKHGFAALLDLLASPERLERATPASPPGLVLEPFFPPTHYEAPLDRLRLVGDRTSHPLGHLFDDKGKMIVRSQTNTQAYLIDAVLAHQARTHEPDPSVTSALERQRSALAHLQRTRELSAKLPAALARLKQPLYPYQLEGVHRFFTRGRLLLADDMGLGKTAQAIAVAHCAFTCGLVDRGLVIVPASLRSQWLREWMRFSDVPARLIEGSIEERKTAYASRARGFTIVGYEMFVRDLDAIKTFEPELVIADEGQRIKNWATKTAHALKELTAPYRLMLTGTPIQNRLEELTSTLEWVDDLALEPKWRLPPFHILRQGDGDRGASGLVNLEALRARTEPVLLRRLRSVVLAQLPPRTDTYVPVAMTGRQIGEHDALTPNIVSLLQRASERPLSPEQFLKLMQLFTAQRVISNGLAQLNFSEMWPIFSEHAATPDLIEGLWSPKLLALRDLVQALVLDQQRKVVIFSQWRRTLRLAEWAIRPLLDAEKIQSVFFTGAESQKVREDAVVRFHDDPSVRVMFLSDAGGVGLNLQRAASACINIELPWNPAVLEQRIGRIHRLGQTNPIDVYNLICDHGIEQRIAQVIASKRILFTEVFDGVSNEVMFDSARSFITQLVEMPPTPIEEPEEEPFDDLTMASLDELLARADEVDLTLDLKSTTAPSASTDTRPLAPSEVANLFGKLRIETQADGGVRIDAPPDAARSLAALFRGMAELMTQLGPSS